MGRSDAVAFTKQWAARARQLGAVVDFEPGWDTRGNGMAANYEGAIVHHTASNSSQASPFPTRSVLINGRPDLKGPLCNVAAPWSPESEPRLVVISARPANHAGASGGKSMGPLPVTGSFNARVFGLEIDYSGVAPMSPGQYRAALIFARAVADVLGRSTEYVRAHAETSVTGKYDPGYAPGKTIDMAAFRRDAAAITPAGDFLMALSDAEQREILAAARLVNGPLAGALARMDSRTLQITQMIVGGNTDGKNNFHWLAEQMTEAVKTVPGAQVDQAQLGAAIAASVTFTEQSIATAVNDMADARDRDGDPTTGVKS